MSADAAPLEPIVGMTFDSYEDVQQFMDAYEELTKTKYWKRSSRRTEGMIQLKKNFSDKLVYYELTYACRFGGQKFRRKGRGLRQTNSFRMDCPAHIKFRANRAGDKLEIRHIEATHSHNNLVQIGAEGATINDSEPAEKRPKIEDYASSMKKALDFLNLRGSDAAVLYDDNDELEGLFFAAPFMKEAMEAWPEFLAMGCIPCYPTLGHHFVVFLVQDSNGEARVVGVGILSDHGKCDALPWLFGAFKTEHLPCFADIKCIVADKFLADTDLFQEHFSMDSGSVTILGSNALEIFRAEAAEESVGDTDLEQAVDLFSRMLNSEDDDEYGSIYEEFSCSVPFETKMYFDVTWHCKQEAWVLHKIINSGFNGQASQRMQEIKGKLEETVGLSMHTFVQGMFEYFKAQELEISSRDFAEKAPPNAVSEYAKALMSAQVMVSAGFEVSKLEDDSLLLNSMEEEALMVQKDTCVCEHWSVLGLPCRHIFAALRVEFSEDLPDFVGELCGKRWTQSYAQVCNRKIINAINESSGDTEKQRQALELTTSLLSLVCGDPADPAPVICDDALYIARMKVLQRIEDIWQRGGGVVVSEIKLISSASAKEK